MYESVFSLWCVYVWPKSSMMHFRQILPSIKSNNVMFKVKRQKISLGWCENNKSEEIHWSKAACVVFCRSCLQFRIAPAWGISSCYQTNSICLNHAWEVRHENIHRQTLNARKRPDNIMLVIMLTHTCARTHSFRASVRQFITCAAAQDQTQQPNIKHAVTSSEV